MGTAAPTAGRPWRGPGVAARVACAALLGAVAVAAAADATPRPADAPLAGGIAVRQAYELRGTPCTSDDDCGGDAIFPPLWCRRGEGADTPTCRAYVGEGEACDSTGVLCDATTEFDVDALSCVGGTCSTFVLGVERGGRCPAGQEPSPCVDGHRCRFVNSLGGDARCVSEGTAGTGCGGPLAICTAGTECIDADTGEACPLRQTFGAPPFEQEEWFAFPVCTNNATAAGGTCRALAAPTVGTLCNDLGDFDDVCGRGGNDSLVCSRVGSLDDSTDLQCVARTAPGAPCALSGASGPGVCSEPTGFDDEQLCIDGKCVAIASPGTFLSTVGNQCTIRGGGDGCAGGDDVVCRSWRGIANLVCWRERVPEGGACGRPAFGICDQEAGLTCADGVCVVAAAAALGAACDNRLDVSCDPAVVGDRSGLMSCRTGPTDGGDSDGGRRCFFICFDGDACTGEFELCPNGRVLDGVCVEGLIKGDPCDHPTAECDARKGLFCRPIDGDGGGSGSNIRQVAGVCAVKAAVGAACDAATADQCADGLACVNGTCAERLVGLGEPCTDDTDCRNTDDGQSTACWRGRGAAGKTCRAWRGPYASCAGADSKCWWPALYCSDDGAASVCVNAEGRGDLGAFCRLDGSDCTAADDLFCAVSRFTVAPVCKRIVGDGEECDAGLGSDLRLCDADAGLVCRYNGRFSDRPVGYYCQPREGNGRR